MEGKKRFIISRRQFLQTGALAGLGLLVPGRWNRPQVSAKAADTGTTTQPRIVAQGDPIAGGTLDPTSIPKFVTPLVIPPAMPNTQKGKKHDYDYYEIAVRQFQQQILPVGLPATTVWSYGAVDFSGTVAEGGTFNYPAFTIEAQYERPVRVNWINDLVAKNGKFLPHILPVDQTLHWANPPGGNAARDRRGTDPNPYEGPVPIVTHVHGAHTHEESDGYPEAWYLPAAKNIPGGYAATGTWYDTFAAQFKDKTNQGWDPGTAVFEYPNDQRATTLWYHDHTLGMTRVNVYAGPAGFYLLRGGPDDEVRDAEDNLATLPGPAPALGDPPGITYYEIPIVIQDRSFNDDGSLFYPNNRAFFEGLDPSQLQIPFTPDLGCDGQPSDVAPIWNPEFFGNTMVVNGNTWPYLDVEQRRYRFRFLNGSDSRFLILEFDDPAVQIWQIGSDGGFLPEPVNINDVNGGRLLLGPAERADVIVDFGELEAGTSVILKNLGPDEPFGGGEPDGDFDVADPQTTGQVMQFRVLDTQGDDPTTPPEDLVLPAIVSLGDAGFVRALSLNEEESANIKVLFDEDGDEWVTPVQLTCDDLDAVPFGPTAALLGTLDDDGNGVPLKWNDDITENPGVGDTETWEFYNFTADAHPIHIHLVQFQVVDRQGLVTNDEGMAEAAVLDGEPKGPEPWETGFKDTVIAYPGQVTRVRARFDKEGLYVWHCHILEHEDNEMMRPYRVVAAPAP